MSNRDKIRIDSILREIKQDEKVLKMKDYIQHGNTTTYEHCERVTDLCYVLNKRMHLNADERILLTGAMLHDFYLYDWHVKDSSHRMHGYHHADTAMYNAVRYFDIDERVQHIIWCHMWPLNISRLPRTREAVIVCFADKCCSVAEILTGIILKKREGELQGGV